MNYIYSLNNIPKNDRTFFIEMLSYISEYVKDISIDIENENVNISYDGTNEENIVESIKFLENMIEVKLKNIGDKVQIKTLEDNTNRDTLNSMDIFQEMLKLGVVKPISSGAFAYSGIFLKVFKYFCKKIEQSIDEIFPNVDKQEFEVPILTPVTDYDEGLYFETFPHHIMFQTTMKNDISIIDKFAKNGISDKSILDEIKTPTNVLRTAACMPLYPFLRDSRISQNEPKIFLVSGKCFRNEGNNIKELSRLNEFYMKEYVFVGTPAQAKSYIHKAYSLWDFWNNTFNINCKIDTANDSFFASNYKKLQLFQMLGDAKREFKWLIPNSSSYISCSSANFHRTHFTKVYNIKTTETDAYCHSSCFAFGIERLTYALLSQKGLDVSKWDSSTREEISKYVNI
ncbi:MAG: hypothetical protein LIO71_00920 [Ruminococcus sp.]|nr:hypothetical protein [Ruminococcus sp.]